MEKSATKPVIAPDIEESWKNLLWDEFQQDYFHELREFLKKEKREGKTVYPSGPEIFSAFNLTPFDHVKVVIIGQDPYHGPEQAHGLCFSVRRGIAPPPSLKNIFKELNSDLSIPVPAHGELTAWAKQGVLLLNAMLTVQAGSPGSHRGRGWEKFTDAAIRLLNEKKENIVFLLWGRFAQEKGAMIDTNKHLVLKAAHPSPFSAHSGFFGCNHFSKANDFLSQKNIEPINWNPDDRSA